MATTLKTIKKLAAIYDVGVDVDKEQGKRVIVLRGKKSKIEQCLNAGAGNGYWIEWADTGAYLYSYRAIWR